MLAAHHTSVFLHYAIPILLTLIGERLSFVREPENPYDKEAIRIQTVNGVKIGYVPKQDNIVFARLMDAGKELFGTITAKELRGKWLKVDIKIFLHE